MANAGQSFQEFERAGWENPGVVAGYHEHMSGITTQSVDDLLDAAGVGKGSRVLDVATGAGYVAGAAARRGAGLIRWASTFRQRRFVWPVSDIRGSGSSRLMRKRFRSSLTASTLSSSPSACVTFRILTSRCARYSGY